MANGLIIAVVVAYMLFMLWIGWYSSKRITSNTDFMLAGRRLGPFLMAGTLAATEIGGGSSLGVVQQGMQNHGISAAWYIITMGLAFVILTFLAPKFRASEVKTVPEYFRRRYGKGAGLLTALIMLVPMIGFTEGQFVASATILSTMLGIGYKPAIIVVAVIVTAYSVMGGLWSVTLTDFVQVFMIVIGMILAGANLKRVFTTARLYAICLCRLILYPLVVIVMVALSGYLKVHPEDLFIFQIAMIAVAAPPANIIAQFAVMYDKDALMAGSYNALGMLLCIVTMPLMMLIFDLLVK